jgi:hypothetical protein
MKFSTAHHQNAFNNLFFIISIPLIIAGCAPSGKGINSQTANSKPKPVSTPIDSSLIPDSLTDASGPLQLTAGGCDSVATIAVVNENADPVAATGPITFSVSSTVTSGSTTVNYYSSYFNCVIDANASLNFTIASGSTHVRFYPKSSGTSEFFMSFVPVVFASGTMKGLAESVGATNSVTTAYTSSLKPKMLASSTAKVGDCVGPYYVDTINGAGVPTAVSKNTFLSLQAADSTGVFGGLIYMAQGCVGDPVDAVAILTVETGRSRSTPFYIKTFTVGPLQVFSRDQFYSSTPTSIGLGSTIASATITFQ